jgi:hypothetical protein
MNRKPKLGSVIVADGLTTSAPDKLLTDDAIRRMLDDRRRGYRSFTEFWKASGMKISYSHLMNVMSGKRPPNDVVLSFLGVDRVEGYRGVNS